MRIVDEEENEPLSNLKALAESKRRNVSRDEVEAQLEDLELLDDN